MASRLLLTPTRLSVIQWFGVTVWFSKTRAGPSFEVTTASSLPSLLMSPIANPRPAHCLMEHHRRRLPKRPRTSFPVRCATALAARDNADVGSCISIVSDHVRLDNQQILPSIVVVVEKTHTPAGMQQRNRVQSRDGRGVIERAVFQIGVERVSLVREIGDDDVRPAVVVIVLKVHAHAGKGVAIAVESSSGSQSHFFERSVAAVVEQIFAALNHWPAGYP